MARSDDVGSDQSIARPSHLVTCCLSSGDRVVDTEIGGMRKVTSGTSDGNPITGAGFVSRGVTSMDAMCCNDHLTSQALCVVCGSSFPGCRRDQTRIKRDPMERIEPFESETDIGPAW